MLNSIKKNFPIFQRKVNDKELVYLDSASTSQKPQEVIDAITNYYETMNANIHRGIYTLSEESTIAYEETRILTANFINAQSEKEIIFTRNTTEAINLVAYSWGENNISKDDEIIVSQLEHHSNFIPWQQLAKRKKAKLQIIPLKDNLTLDMEAYANLLSEKTKLVCISAVSNVLGTMPDLKKIIEGAHQKNARVLIDGAQSVGHMKTDVQKLDCDFFTFSSHKMLGPTGVGVLYGKQKLLENMPPLFFGGGMVKTVTKDQTTFADLPQKFEAGTQNIADIIGFAQAIKFLNQIGLDQINQHDKKLMDYTRTTFSKYPQVKLYAAPESTSVLSFTIDGIHPHDIAQIFSDHGVAIRAGHHCAQPLMQGLKLAATARISFYLYNTTADIDRAEEALQAALKTFNIN